MPSFKLIRENNIYDQWQDSQKFNGSGCIVKEDGSYVTTRDYQGRKFRLVAKKEQVLSLGNRLARGFIGTVGAILSIAYLLFIAVAIVGLFLYIPTKGIALGCMAVMGLESIMPSYYTIKDTAKIIRQMFASKKVVRLAVPID